MSSEIVIKFLVAAVLAGTPFLFGTVGEILSEKVGHLNLGVEGFRAVCDERAVQPRSLPLYDADKPPGGTPCVGRCKSSGGRDQLWHFPPGCCHADDLAGRTDDLLR